MCPELEGRHQRSQIQVWLGDLGQLSASLWASVSPTQQVPALKFALSPQILTLMVGFPSGPQFPHMLIGTATSQTQLWVTGPQGKKASKKANSGLETALELSPLGKG